MKLVITTDCFLPRWDGIARFLNGLLPFLDGWDVTVFAPDFGEPPRLPANVILVQFPLVRWRFGDIFFASADASVMRNAIRGADLVFNQTIGPIGKKGIRMAKKFKKPVVSFVHSVEWTLVSLALKRFCKIAGCLVKRRARSLYNDCSLLLVPSHEVEDVLMANRIRARKEVVHLGVDVSFFSPPYSKALAKRKIDLSSSVKVVGFLGRIAREKDPFTLLAAFRKVKKKFPECVLLLVGAGLEAEISSSKSVLRTGRQDDVVPFLQAMDVFVLPSLTETTSLATMEAMACGIPVVVTPVGSLREYIVDGENGLFFPRQDAGALADKLVYLLSNDKERSRLGAEARKTIVDKFDWEKSAQNIRSLLQNQV